MITLGALTALLVVAYWDMFALTSAAWEEDLYSHGYIIPLFSLALLWMRWQPFQPVPTSERWMGLAVWSAAWRFVSWQFTWSQNPLDRYSFLIAIEWIVSDGWRLAHLRWAGPGDRLSVFHVPAAGDSGTRRAMAVADDG